MDNFGRLLHKYLKNKPSYSISAFAKDIGISAGLLNHIFNGKRTMSADKFYKTVNNNIFDLRERENLRDAYFIERYGESDYKKLQLLSKTIIGLHFGAAPEINICTRITDNGYGELETKEEIFSALKELFSSTGNEIYTNIRHSNNAVNDVLYSLKKEFSSSALTRFVSGFSPKITEKSLSSLFSIIRFAKAGVNTLSLEKNEAEHLDKTTLFPYFIISDKMLILLDAQYEKGIALTGEKIVSDKYSKCILTARESQSVVNFFKNEFEAVNYIINFESEKIFSLKSTPCFLAVNDLSFLSEAMADCSDKKELISFLNNRRTDKQWYNVCTQSGLENFLETGKTYEISRTFINNFSLKSRQLFIDSLIDTMKNDKIYHNTFLERNIIISDFFKNIDISVYDNSCLIATIPDEPDDKSFLCQISLHIKGGEFLRICKIFLSDYLVISGEVLSNQTSMLYLKGIQIELQRRDK